jgi:Flp pilus assembly protein TadG
MRIAQQRGPWQRKGQALAEFALILPVLFLLIAGIIEFGRGWNIKQAVTDAAREGARYSVVDHFPEYTIDDVKAKVRARLALAGISTTNPPTTITVTDELNWHKTGEEITMQVSTLYRMGWVGALLGWAGGSSTVTISSEATMRNEGN